MSSLRKFWLSLKKKTRKSKKSSRKHENSKPEDIEVDVEEHHDTTLAEDDASAYDVSASSSSRKHEKSQPGDHDTTPAEDDASAYDVSASSSYHSLNDDVTEDSKVTVTSTDGESVRWRKRGNERYEAAGAAGIAALLQKTRLQEAIDCYQKSYDTAANPTEQASAAKNIGTANRRLAAAHRAAGAFAAVKETYKQSLTYLDRARICGETCMEKCWVESVENSLRSCIDQAFTCHNYLPYRTRAALYENYIQCLQDSIHKAWSYLQLAILLFNGAVVQLEKNNYKQVLNDLTECYRPVEEARRLSSDDIILVNKVNELAEDRLLHSCIAESVQAIDIADDMFEHLLKDQEELYMTQVYEILDWYKKAIILTREKSVETEAIANSKIGVLYQKVIKCTEKAHEYFMRSMELARSLQPRNFGTEKWFQYAAEFLKKLQEKKLEQENEVWRKERVPYVEQLKDKLKSLEDADSKKSAVEFLQYVYKTHPPKRTDQKMVDIKDSSKPSQTELKAVFKKALLHYHPDKQKEHGQLWLVLSEEITKLLTRRYESYKFSD